MSLRTTAVQIKKKENWDTKSQMSIASAHVKRLLPYRSCKIYPKAWSEMTRSSARIPNLLSYYSYRPSTLSGNNRNFIEKFSITTSQISTVRKHPNIFSISNNILKKIKPDNGDSISNQCKTIFKPNTSTTNIAAHLHGQNNQEEVNILEPVSSNTVTHWNSTYFILKRLLELRNAIEKLSKSLIRDPDRGIRADGNILKEKILSNYNWQGLEELSNLLHPFAQASIYMSGSHYPTLSIMYLIMYRIFKHLNQIESNLTYISVIDTHKHIRELLVARWEDPKMTGWLATILDPRFKSLTIATSTMRNVVIQELHQKIMQSKLFNSNSIKTIVATSNNISLFFDDQEDLNSFSNIDTELQIYFSIPQIPKYDIGDPLYKKYNPLIW
ncbi:hypothetical protein Glove_353g1 [Diversispora epigaea]|uniref:Uncharacterized protein n=1 Tax=Diversispora epigaea TaxID=1348612 RepID=A0A397HFW5_9GLOM|nr:hypothetical protein Glove_353g1 [Diversispora epigaea]